MTTYHHVNLPDVDAAQWLATLPLFLANGHRPDAVGTTVTLTTHALARLASLPEDEDGHYDGTDIWLGGYGYKVEEVTA